MGILRVRAILGVDKTRITAVIMRAQAMYDGMNGDKATYSAPNPPLPAFLTLIQNTVASHQAVSTRVVGARESRDVSRDLLLTGMESERVYVQSVADSMPSRAAAIIRQAGLLVAGSSGHVKGILVLRNGKQPGTVTCDANVGMLVGTDAAHPNEARFFGWEYTTDGSKSFVSLPSTTKGKTVIQGLTPLTMVGVRVNLTNSEGPGAWSQVVSILVL